MTNPTDAILDRYHKRLRQWRRNYAFLITIHFGVGLLAVTAPVIMTTELLSSLGTHANTIVGLIGSVSAILIAFLNPARYAHGFYNAASRLEVARDRWSARRTSDKELEKLVDEYEMARSTIGEVQPKKSMTSKYLNKN